MICKIRLKKDVGKRLARGQCYLSSTFYEISRMLQVSKVKKLGNIKLNRPLFCRTFQSLSFPKHSWPRNLFWAERHNTGLGFAEPTLGNKMLHSFSIHSSITTWPPAILLQVSHSRASEMRWILSLTLQKSGLEERKGMCSNELNTLGKAESWGYSANPLGHHGRNSFWLLTWGQHVMGDSALKLGLKLWVGSRHREMGGRGLCRSPGPRGKGNEEWL
jgi:hypothetical protein